MKTLFPGALDADLLAELRRLHFETRRLADQGISGSYRSAFRGRGIEFEEVREYFPGDDIRSIDWKVTARSGKPHVKSYREERELTVMIAVDTSASTATGTRCQTKEALIARLGAILTLIALQNNDKVGLVTYSDRLESYQPPRKARSATWRILHEVLSPRELRKATDLSGLFTFLNQVLKKRAIIFIISDFVDNGYETPLAVLAKKHDLTAILVKDPADFVLPDSGLISMVHPETREHMLIDTHCATVRQAYTDFALEAHNRILSKFRKHRIDVLPAQTDKSFIPTLRDLFAQKEKATWGRR
jgi:uncharacterized protein (DUF58 family)